MPAFAVLVVLAMLAMFVGALLADRRRRRQADRWAKTAGIDRMPGESTQDLLRRVGQRWTIRGPWR